MSANSRQIDGDHYSVNGQKLQHWDVARIFNFDPMQYQITKHVFRWKDKHPTFEKRLQDLQKSQHYLEKYIEDAKTWDDHHVRLPAAHIIVNPRAEADIDREWEDQTTAMTRFHTDGFTKEGGRYQCIACRLVVSANSPLSAATKHSIGACPGRAGKLVAGA